LAGDQVELDCPAEVLDLELGDLAYHQGGVHGEVQVEAFADHPVEEAWGEEVDLDSLKEVVLGDHDPCLVRQEDHGPY